MKSFIRTGAIASLFALASPNLLAQELPKPTPLQMEWQDLETIAFIHFSINTYTDMEWGYGNESPAIFNPTNLDCRQWVRTCKEAGLKGVILTAKHHDGFCLWPSKYTEHSVKNSPWKNGQGDLVKEFSDACKEYGLKMGLYLSPWDCNHPDYGKPEYNDYFCGQLEELLTNYGDVFEIWFDGANGGRGYYGTDSLHTRNISENYYDWDRISKIVKNLQPNCILHGGAIADIRWVGNEEGYAGEEHWSPLRTYDKFDEKLSAQAQFNKGHQDGSRWMPSETDVSIRPGWYYHASEDHKLKSLSKLIDIYYESVGRNSLLLLNIPPNKEGLVHPEDSVRLVEWRKQYEKELADNLINKKSVVTVNGSKKKLHKMLDSNPGTYVTMPAQSEILIDFKKPTVFNRLLLTENIRNGQRVKQFEVEIFNNGQWSSLDKQTTIGYKRILRFPETTAEKIRIKIGDSFGNPEISSVEVFNAPIILNAPTVRRNKEGIVRISNGSPYVDIRYTTDGSTPTVTNSILYKEPFAFNNIGTIKTIAVSGNTVSEITSREFPHTKEQWEIVGYPNANKSVFDENIHSAWIAPRDVKEVVVDLAGEKQISKLKWTPDQARWSQGIITQYEVYVTNDPENWGAPVLKGEFGNIENNPIEQELIFSTPAKGRFVKLKALKTVGNQRTIGVSELDFEFVK